MERGGDLRFYHEMMEFTQDGQHVNVIVQNRETGHQQQITANYLIAADGANSPVRRKLNIGYKGVDYFTEQLGTRLPHLWLDEQQQQSTLDWVKGEFILIVTGSQQHQQAVCRQLETKPDLQLSVYWFTLECDVHAWQQQTSTRAGEALLIRPDGFVGCHLSATDIAISLETIINTVLQKQ